VGRRQQKMLVVTEDVEKPSGWFVVCGVLILPWVPIDAITLTSTELSKRIPMSLFKTPFAGGNRQHH